MLSCSYKKILCLLTPSSAANKWLQPSFSRPTSIGNSQIRHKNELFSEHSNCCCWGPTRASPRSCSRRSTFRMCFSAFLVNQWRHRQLRVRRQDDRVSSGVPKDDKMLQRSRTDRSSGPGYLPRDHSNQISPSCCHRHVYQPIGVGSSPGCRRIYTQLLHENALILLTHLADHP